MLPIQQNFNILSQCWFQPYGSELSHNWEIVVSAYLTLQEIIDNGDDYDEVPNSKCVVTRTAYKDNSSFYQVM